MALKVGFTAIRQGVKAPKFHLGTVRIALHAYTQQFLERVVERTRPYPPPPSDAYQRTYTLERSWDVVDVSYGVGIAYEIQNRATDPKGRQYAGLVHGPRGQWSVHASHGWQNIGEVLDKMGGRGQFRSRCQDIITHLMGAV